MISVVKNDEGSASHWLQARFDFLVQRLQFREQSISVAAVATAVRGVFLAERLHRRTDDVLGVMRVEPNVQVVVPMGVPGFVMLFVLMVRCMLFGTLVVLFFLTVSMFVMGMLIVMGMLVVMSVLAGVCMFVVGVLFIMRVFVMRVLGVSVLVVVRMFALVSMLIFMGVLIVRRIVVAAAMVAVRFPGATLAGDEQPDARRFCQRDDMRVVGQGV